MVSPTIWFLAGLTAPKLYEKFVDVEDKKAWKKLVGIHHGEAGVLMLLGGVAASNAGLAAFGIGLAIEDWVDKEKWFKNSDSKKNDLEQEDKSID